MVLAWRWSRSRLLAGYQGCRRGACDHGGPSAGQGKSSRPRVHRSRSTLPAPLAHGQFLALRYRLQIKSHAEKPAMTTVLDAVRGHYRATGLTERLKTALT